MAATGSHFKSGATLFDVSDIEDSKVQFVINENISATVDRSELTTKGLTDLISVVHQYAAGRQVADDAKQTIQSAIEQLDGYETTLRRSKSKFEAKALDEIVYISELGTIKSAVEKIYITLSELPEAQAGKKLGK